MKNIILTLIASALVLLFFMAPNPLFAADNDGDGVADALEDGGPFTGDFDGNTTPDRFESNVVGLPGKIGYIYLFCIAPAQFSNVSTNSYAGAEGVVFPFGAVGFDIDVAPGGTREVWLYWVTDEYSASDLGGFKWYGKTPPNWSTRQWWQVPYCLDETPEDPGLGDLREGPPDVDVFDEGFASAPASSPAADPPATGAWCIMEYGDFDLEGTVGIYFVLKVTDNEFGDSNPVSGIINDPIAPFVASASVPASNGYGIFALAGLISIFGVLFILKKQI